MPQGRDGHAHCGESGPVFGGTAGALAPGATHGGGRRRTWAVIAPSSGEEPGGVPMGCPGGASESEGINGQGDVPVFGTLPTMDMDLEALTIEVSALKKEGGMEPAAQARDRGAGDLVVQGGVALRSRRTSATLRTAGRRRVVGARRSARVCQSRLRTCGEKKRMPLEQMRMDVGARPSTFLRCRKERCSSCAEMRLGDVWENGASRRTSRTEDA